MAGESARESARRQREKAERLQRSADLYARGAEGEEATAAALASLPAESWTVFHDLRWPGRRFANVDHVVVGPPGVFVIDSKNWTGRVTVKDDVLRQNGFLREKNVAGAAEAGMAVARLVPLLRPHLVHPVLCFVREEELTGWARDVMICSTVNVAAMLLSRPAVLNAEEVRQLTLDVDAGLRSATEPVDRLQLSTPSTPAGPSRRNSTRASRRRRKSSTGLVPAVLGLGLVFVLMTQPEVVSGLADRIGDVITEQAQPDKPPAPPKMAHRKQRDR